MQAPVKQSLEAALVHDPDDLAAHSAYADYLMEQRDPRGEFIQVQLLLEDASRPPKEQAELRHREKHLLRQHGKQWLGEAGRFLHGKWTGPDKPYEVRFARGWLDSVRVLPAPDAIVAALARSPECRLLRRLEVVYDMRFHPFDFDEHVAGPNKALTEDEVPNELYEPATIMPPLIASPYMSNLRVFKLGFSDGNPPTHSTMVQPFDTCTADQIIQLLEKCPRLEELYVNDALAGIERLFAHPILGNIRVLQHYYGNQYTRGSTDIYQPYVNLANNVALAKLTTLRLHPGRDSTIAVDELDALVRSPHMPSLTDLQVHMTTFGDAGCSSIVDSGILSRLKLLDIGYGNMSDAGASMLAACPHLKHLDVLNVARNALTTQGIAALEATGIRVIATDQHGPGEEDYLYEVDVE